LRKEERGAIWEEGCVKPVFIGEWREERGEEGGFFMIRDECSLDIPTYLS